MIHLEMTWLGELKLFTCVQMIYKAKLLELLSTRHIASVSLLNFCLFLVIIDNIIHLTFSHVKCLGDLLSTSD